MRNFNIIVDNSADCACGENLVYEHLKYPSFAEIIIVENMRLFKRYRRKDREAERPVRPVDDDFLAI